MSGTASAGDHRTCPACSEPAEVGALFCEGCGTRLPEPLVVEPSAEPVGHGTEDSAPSAPSSPATVLTRVSGPVGAAPCRACGGRVADDGWCESCGTPAAAARDHWVATPAAWVAAVCDRGVRHARNEDAMAVDAAGEIGGRAVLVVCDGVSSAPDSDQASLAAATAARDLLVAHPGGAWDDVLVAAAAAGGQAILDTVGDKAERRDPPSCTFVATVVEGSTATTAWLGDSRAYWVPDAGTAVQLTVDDSWVEEMVARGFDREQAEGSLQAHAITRWLGPDSGDPAPRVVTTPLEATGWVLLCSDGLWNYCPTSDGLTTLVRTATVEVGPDPTALASWLVRWAVDQGGADNITVALARHSSDNLPDDDTQTEES